MKIKIALILLLNAAFVNAQQKRLTGIVVDINTNAPVANATVCLIHNNLFFPADSSGKFDVPNTNLTGKDSISFSCIGYQTKKETVTDLLSDGLIKLKPLVTVLNEVTIGNKPKVLVKVGSKKSSGLGDASLFPGTQIAMFMPGSADLHGTIQNVGFCVSNGNIFERYKGDATAPFRVRLYEVDTSGEPGNELTKDVIVVSAKKSGRWFDIDISAYGIETPRKGFFVSFCLLNNEYYIDQNAEKNHTGFMMSAEYIKTPRLVFPQHEFKENLSYSGMKSDFGPYWHKYPHLNFMIRAVVAVD